MPLVCNLNDLILEITAHRELLTLTGNNRPKGRSTSAPPRHCSKNRRPGEAAWRGGTATTLRHRTPRAGPAPRDSPGSHGSGKSCDTKRKEVTEKVPVGWGDSCPLLAPRQGGHQQPQLCPALPLQQSESYTCPNQAEHPQNLRHTLSPCYGHSWELLWDTVWFGVCDGFFCVSERRSASPHTQRLGSPAQPPSEPQILLPACGSREL